MKFSIVYSSNTGNTELLAKAIRDILPVKDCVYYGEPDRKALEGDLIFAGFWTDKGTCDEKIASFIKEITGKRAALFGTAGFGKEQSYFDSILKRVEECSPKGTAFADGFMCQGKMSFSVRERYVAMLEADPGSERAKMLIENFDCALSHPDENDLKKVQVWAQKVIRAN